MPANVQDEPAGATPTAQVDASPSEAPTSPNDVSLAVPASAADLLDASKWDGDKFIGKTTADASTKEEADSDTASEQQASDDAAAAEEPAYADDPKPIDPALVTKLFEENRQLLKLKGKQGNELGAARDRVAELEARLARLEKGDAAPDAATAPQTEEEWDTLFTTNPRKALELWNAEKQAAEQAAVERQRQEELQEVVTVTPEVGAELFTRQFGIENFDKWSESDEGNAVLETLGSDEDAKLALAAAIQYGNAPAVARILGKGLRIVRSQAKVTETKAKATSETQRIEASKPTSVARPGRAVAPAPSKPVFAMSSAEMLKMSDDEYERARQASR